MRPLAIDDTRTQPIFSALRVTHDLNIGSYIGVPIVLSSGLTYGTLCAIDPDPHRFTEDEISTLILMARLLASEIDRDEAMRALRSSEAKYRAIFDNVQDVFYQTDIRGRIVEISPAIERYSGYRRDELLGSPVDILYVNANERVELLQELRTAGEVVDRLVSLRHRAGRVVYTSVNAHFRRDADGNVIGVEGSLRDITARKWAEERLQEALAETIVQKGRAESLASQVGAVLDASATAIVLVDAENRVQMINRRHVEMFGFPAEELLGRTLFDLAPQIERCLADADRFALLLADLMGDPSRQVEDVPMTQRWPAARQLVLHSAGVSTPNGDYVGRLIAFRDVTREHEVDRMKTEFVSLVSHELRTPLTSIKGYVDLLLEDAAVMVAEHVEFLGIVKSNTDRLTSLVNDLLDIARIEDGKVELRLVELPIGRILSGVVELMRPQIVAKGQKVALDVPPDLPLILADADRLTQVVINLLSNACKYTPRGGSIDVSAHQADEAIRVDVTDTGIGLSPDDQARLFTKFFRAANHAIEDAGGTGLGLAITRSLVEMHGGHMSVASVPGAGSTFSFTLPVTRAGASSPATA